jgi:two-component system chemotaxis response regulator CheB
VENRNTPMGSEGLTPAPGSIQSALMIRVLIAEDSATIRELLREIFLEDQEITVVGTAHDGADAVEKTRRLYPDVITMDIQMPRLDGFEATRQIMAGTPTPIVILSSNVDVGEVEVSMRALALGALALLPKPLGPGSADFERSCQKILSTVKAMSQVKVVRRWDRQEPQRSPRHRSSERRPLVRTVPPLVTPRSPQRSPAPQIVTIAASTGGPPALHRLFAALPRPFAVPILVVQHLGDGFADGFVSWLDSVVSQPVELAKDGEKLVAGTVYVAPDDRHLEVASHSRLRLSTSPPRDHFRPSGDVLFESAAKVYGAAAVAVILTGMGRDGLNGLREVWKNDGYIIAQNEATSVVFGMPGEAVAAGLANEILSPEAIARSLQRLTS